MDFKLGNKKIGTDTLIFNMGSATNCASKLAGLCDIDCYAMKAERQYKAVLPYRTRQEKAWLNNDSFEIAEQITSFLAKKRNVVKYVRVNEAGDLHSEKCLYKLIELANMLPELKFYTYTHRSDIITDNTAKELPKNLVINTSDFKRKGLNQFKAVKVSFKVKSHQKQAKEIRKDIQETFNTNIVCMGDCSTCNLCKINHKKDIYVPIH